VYFVDPTRWHRALPFATGAEPWTTLKRIIKIQSAKLQPQSHLNKIVTAWMKLLLLVASRILLVLIEKIDVGWMCWWGSGAPVLAASTFSPHPSAHFHHETIRSAGNPLTEHLTK
jgi:hypothetical protein